MFAVVSRRVGAAAGVMSPKLLSIGDAEVQERWLIRHYGTILPDLRQHLALMMMGLGGNKCDGVRKKGASAAE
jgi:hypothetical protein